MKSIKCSTSLISPWNYCSTCTSVTKSKACSDTLQLNCDFTLFDFIRRYCIILDYSEVKFSSLLWYKCSKVHACTYHEKEPVVDMLRCRKRTLIEDALSPSLRRSSAVLYTCTQHLVPWRINYITSPSHFAAVWLLFP